MQHGSEESMAIRSTKIWIPLCLLVLLISACQTATQPPPPAEEPEVEQTLNALIEALTAQAAANNHATEPPESAQEVQAGETPSITPTETASVTPTDTYTFTPSVPIVSVSSETNCRTGPSRYYKLVDKVEPGTRFMMAGRHAPSGYWIIRLEDGGECWLWGEYALPEGSWTSLPEYSQPQVGRIEGTVQKTSAADAQKISHAFVDVGLNDFKKYETGNDGFFVFEDVPAGEVNLSIQHSSYLFVDTRVIVRTGNVSAVTILPAVPSSLRTPTPTSNCPPFLPRCTIFITPLPSLP
jgi:uncharacterized protein YgiM (DUF1202 family)